MKLRDASVEDAKIICEVLRQSISELCTLDHGNNSVILGKWLKSKTAESVENWIKSSNNSMIVTVDEDNKIVAVGCLTKSGEVNLNYVHPRARFKGVSKMVMMELEQRAVEQKNLYCNLTSTKTARTFYTKLGFKEMEIVTTKFGLVGYKMSKQLCTTT